jgi:hypothetical protein
VNLDRSRGARLALGLTAALLLAPLPSAAEASFHVHVTDLNGVDVEIPSGLPQARTLMLVGFHHADHAALEAWQADGPAPSRG